MRLSILIGKKCGESAWFSVCQPAFGYDQTRQLWRTIVDNNGVTPDFVLDELCWMVSDRPSKNEVFRHDLHVTKVPQVAATPEPVVEAKPKKQKLAS